MWLLLIIDTVNWGGHELSVVELYLIANTKLKIFLNPWIRTVSAVDF